MPFGDGFMDIDQVIKDVAMGCGLRYVRGDMSKRPGSILAQIVKEITHAAVVVADVSRANPNVFYELGIAHQILGPERVVIINQDLREKQPYDVHQFRQLQYTHNREGLEKLLGDLPERIREAQTATKDQEHWQVIKGGLSRTKMIVRDLQKLIKGGERKRLEGVTIRIVAGLSSLAISDNEPADAKADGEYIKALLEERNALRDALLRGARLKAVLNPPRRFAQSLKPERLSVRYKRMVGLLQGRSDIKGDPTAAKKDLAAMKNCEFTLSPVPMPNLLIIDDTIAYEGLKRGGTGGFEMTHWETNTEELHHLILEFDRFFDDSKRDMLHTHPPDGCLAKQLQDFFEEARALEQRRKRKQ
jgi:hypothetical protein